MAKLLDMTEGSPARLLLRFSVPAVVGNLAEQLYLLADKAIVGRYVGAGAFSAVGATNAPIFVFMSLCIGTQTGIGILAAQHYGAGEEDQAWTIFGVGSLLMTAVSLGLTALVIAIGGRTIALFGVGEGAVATGQRFFEGIAPFYLVYGLAMAVRGYLEGLGDLVYTSLWGMGALAVRIVASYAGAPRWGNQIIAYAEAFSWGVLLALYLGRAAWKRRRPAA